MHARPAALVGAVMLATSAGAAARADVVRTAAAAPVLDDECAVPKGWAPPFTRVYDLRNGTTLVFVAVEHTDHLDDATHRALRAAFDTHRPAQVLVEGTSARKSGLDWYRQALGAEAIRRTAAGAAGENLYSVKLAIDQGARFGGWDFSPDEDYAVLLAHGFTIPDALGAHLLRSHLNPFAGGTEREVERQLRYATQVQPIRAFDYPGWYRHTYGETFRPQEGTPCGDGVASRAVRTLSKQRTLNIARLIGEQSRPGEVLLVEAGANHWLALRDWLASIARRTR